MKSKARHIIAVYKAHNVGGRKSGQELAHGEEFVFESTPWASRQILDGGVQIRHF